MFCCVHDCNQVLNNHWLIIRQLVTIIEKRGYCTTYYFSYKIYNWCIGEPHVQFCFRFNVDSSVNLRAIQKETSVDTRNLLCNYIWILLFCSFLQLTQSKDPNWEKRTMPKKRPWRMQYPTTTGLLVTAVSLVAIHQLRSDVLAKNVLWKSYESDDDFIAYSCAWDWTVLDFIFSRNCPR